ncbi:MAG: glycosyltransferase family 2 protein, partial [Candidatus Heimdallarchaeota archaeon]|nr:glycosyltransferase family 2 protein [Candidatus Heimdallarchaeota archaeon]
MLNSDQHHLSIALLTYNRCTNGYLKQALNAILNQTYSDFELLVIDNYSTDKTADLVLSYNDPRLIYVRQPPGGNATTSYNHAL